jgi:hypothetical protein
MSKFERSIQQAERRRAKFRQLVTENQTFPLATITYHGPSPDKASKIVVGILTGDDAPPLIHSWEGEDITEDVDCAREISQFIKEHDVARVLTSEWVLSCPHEEGVDYPAGGICPFCPDWQPAEQ